MVNTMIRDSGLASICSVSIFLTMAGLGCSTFSSSKACMAWRNLGSSIIRREAFEPLREMASPCSRWKYLSRASVPWVSASSMA